MAAETFGKCAYCESHVKTTSHGSVDHYRPQSKYWWLAYCYDNFLFSCGICNSDYKKDFFPVSGRRLTAGMTANELTPDGIDREAGMHWAEFQAQHEAEQPHIPDPYLDDPEQDLAWMEDPNGKKVNLVASNLSQRAGRVASALAACGVNREEVARRRYEVLQVLKATMRLLQVEPDEAEREAMRIRLERMAEEHNPYAGMARFYLRAWNLI